MVDKVFTILGSVRFWIVTLTALVAILDGDAVLTVVQGWLAAVAAIGTLDSVASRFAGTKV